MGIVVSKKEVEIEISIEILKATSVQLPDNVTVTKNFIDDWGNNPKDIMWDVTFNSYGIFNVAVGISNSKDHSNALIEVEINGIILMLDIISDMYYEKCTRVPIGTLSVNSPGFSTIRARSKEAEVGAVGRLYFLELSGPAIKNLTNHSSNCRSFIPASDIYLKWKYSSSSFTMFYNEVFVSNKKTDCLFVACGFRGGYVGLKQGNIVFEMESPELDISLPEGRIPKLYKISTYKHAEGAQVKYYNSKTKVICSYSYRWKTNIVYHFVVTCKLSLSENNFMLYSAFFYDNDSQAWILLATFKVGNKSNNSFFTRLYSSIEKCRSYHGFNNYESAFGPAMINVPNKGWAHLIKAQFFQEEGKNKPTDVKGYVSENKFVISTGQPARPNHPVPEWLSCTKSPLPECLVGFDPNVLIFKN